MAKFTTSDIQRIAENMRNAKKVRKPYALLLGAGISKTAGIPTAPELVQEIHEDFRNDVAQMPADEKYDYGSCMALLSVNERRRMLKRHLDRAKINLAHIAIATLMKDGFVSRVLSFNFDSVLEQACGRVGHYPAVYDLGHDPPKTFFHLEPGSIIHLHGQGSSLAMLNSKTETEKHAKSLLPLFENTFEQFPILAAGYSGKADAAFAYFKDAFHGTNRLDWTMFDDEAPAHVSELLAKASSTSQFVGGADADEFFVELSRQLNLYPPTVLDNYYDHLLEELKPVIAPTTGPLASAGDILRQTREELTTKSKQRKDDNLAARLETLLNKGDNEAVIALQDSAQTPEEKNLVAWGFINSGNMASDAAQLLKNADAPEWQESFAKYARAVEIKPDMHVAFNNWGLALSDLAKLRNSLDAPEWQESFAKYARAVEIKPDMHEAFFNWGNALSDLAKLRNSLDAPEWQESFAKYARAVEIEREDHEAFFNWGAALFELAKLRNSLDAPEWQESFAKYARAVEIKPDMHEAFNNWGNALSGLAKLRNAADAPEWQECFAKYAKAVEIKPDKHEAFYNWGTALSNLAKLRNSLDAPEWQESFAKYARAVEIKPDKHEAFYNWGSALSNLAKLRNSLDAPEWQESFAKYARAVAINPDDHMAFYNWGTALMDLAKLRNAADAPEWSEALNRLMRAREITELPSYNLACFYALRRRFEECRAELEACLAAGTLPWRAHLDGDTDLDAVRGLDWFAEILARVV